MVDLPLPVMLASVLMLHVPSPRRMVQTKLTPHLTWSLSSGGSDRSHFASRPMHTFLKCAPFGWGPNTAHNRQQESLHTTALKDKVARTQQ